MTKGIPIKRSLPAVIVATGMIGEIASPTSDNAANRGKLPRTP